MKIIYEVASGKFHPAPRDDGAEIVGLSPGFEVYELITLPRPGPDTDTYRYVPMAVADHTAKVLTRGWEQREIPTEAVSVSMRALRFALSRSGLLSGVNAFVNAIPDPDMREEASIWWGYSLTVRRDHPVVAQFAAALSQTPEQIDALFELAAQIDATL